jgi:hypothetical protein
VPVRLRSLALLVAVGVAGFAAALFASAGSGGARLPAALATESDSPKAVIASVTVDSGRHIHVVWTLPSGWCSNVVEVGATISGTVNNTWGGGVSCGDTSYTSERIPANQGDTAQTVYVQIFIVLQGSGSSFSDVAQVSVPPQRSTTTPAQTTTATPTAPSPAGDSATVDNGRHLVVTYTAPDTMQYGGHVYLDNDPRDPTQLSGSTRYGQFMYCVDQSTCKTSFPLPMNSGTGPFTFKSDALSCTAFPPGTWYVQVEGYNQDPYPSTRQWEESKVITITLPPCSSGGSSSSTQAKTTPKTPPKPKQKPKPKPKHKG